MPTRAPQIAQRDDSRLALSPDEAAARMGVCSAQVRRWCRLWRDTRGRAGLRHARLGARLILIRPEYVAAMLDQAATSGGPDHAA
jgi:transposase-like protein